MKQFLITCFILSTIYGFSQTSQDIKISGTILSNDSLPLENAYIINFRDLKTVFSDENGRFNIRIQKNDSLAISYLGYMRKIFKADSTRLNNNYYLELDTINIRQINIFTDPVDIWKNAQQNVNQVKNSRFPTFTKISSEKNLIRDFVTEHNRFMRSEASSLSLLRISPSEVIGSVVKKMKVRKSIRENRKKRQNNSQ